jgi:hypothetical protein
MSALPVMTLTRRSRLKESTRKRRRRRRRRRACCARPQRRASLRRRRRARRRWRQRRRSGRLRQGRLSWRRDSRVVWILRGTTATPSTPGVDCRARGIPPARPYGRVCEKNSGIYFQGCSNNESRESRGAQNRRIALNGAALNRFTNHSKICKYTRKEHGGALGPDRPRWDPFVNARGAAGVLGT